MTTDLPKIKKEIRGIIKTKTREEWREIFKNYDACVEPVLTLAEALSNPQARERGMVVELPIPGGGSVKQLAHPIKYSETAPEYRHIGLPAGTHTFEVLKNLGYSDQEIAEFEKSGLFS